MSIRIINYNNIRNLKNHRQYNFLRNTLHICATADMTKGMYKTYGDDFNKPIISIGDVSRYISGSWEDSLEKLAQYTVITRCIKEIEEFVEDEDLISKDYKNLIKAAKRNKFDILESIRHLIECNVDIERFTCKTNEEKLFIKIWKKFECYYENNSLNCFKDVYFSENSYNEKFYSRFKDAIIKSIEVQEKRMNDNLDTKYIFKKSIEDINSEIPKAIVFHGFYYIKPIHDRLIELVEASGIDIVFLNLYDSRYCNSGYENNDNVFEIYDKSFDRSFGYPSKDKWIYDDFHSENKLSDVFDRIYSYKNQEQVCQIKDYKVINYNKSIEFVNDYRSDEYYYSSESKVMNDILKEYYPDKYSKRHFLSYPIGQFIYSIHSMWDEDLKEFKLTIDTLQQLFSSGWLNLKVNGRTLKAINYTYDLYKIEAYMEYCITIDDWIGRLQSLIENNKRVKQENIEYLDKFSFFNVDIDRLEVILEFVVNIKDIVNSLSENYKTTINKYFENLLKVVNDIELKSDAKIEENIVSNFKEILSNGIDRDIECYTEDIIKALTLVLKGDFENDENDIYEDRKEIVKSIKKIESAPLLYNEDTCVHICQMSEKYMKKNNNLTWPLNKYNLDRIFENSEPDTKRLLKRLKIISENSEAINKYLFYCMLHATKNIKISWVKNYNGEILDKALYIELLEKYIESSIDEDYKTTQVFSKVESYRSRKIDISPSNIEINKICEAEKNICIHRFNYSYLANNKSVYNSDFQHQHLFTSLVRYEAYKNRYKTNYVFSNIEGMFPQWKSIEKNQFAKYIGQYIPYRNYEYKEQVNIVGYNYILNDNRSLKCIYCPHIDYCRFAQYPIDKGKEI